MNMQAAGLATGNTARHWGLAACLLCCLLVGFNQTLYAAQKLTMGQMLQRIMDTYPSLRIAQLEVARAQQESARVESLLGWNLFSQAGVARDVSFTGSSLDRFDATAGLERRLQSGASLGMSGNYRYEDANSTISPLLPNPAHNSGVDLNYRMPFGRGRDNPEYSQGLISADASVDIADADRQAVRDQIASQAIDLYFAAAFTRARIKDADDAIQRARRLKAFIEENVDMGLLEEKDSLQAQAQLQARIADRRNLNMVWEQQRTSLNRLMGQPPALDFVPIISYPKQRSVQFDAILNETENNSPDLRRNQAQVKQADAVIGVRRDTRKDVVDVILSAGARRTSGDTITGNVDRNELVGGVSLEYRRALDKQGFDAELYQAQLSRSIALEQIVKVKEDLHYEVSRLVAEIDVAYSSIQSFRFREDSEKRKVDEAIERFRTGRADTTDLIQFENEFHLSRLLLQQQDIEQARRYASLALLRGQLWDKLSQSYRKTILPEKEISQ